MSPKSQYRSGSRNTSDSITGLSSVRVSLEQNTGSNACSSDTVSEVIDSVPTKPRRCSPYTREHHVGSEPPVPCALQHSTIEERTLLRCHRRRTTYSSSFSTRYTEEDLKGLFLLTANGVTILNGHRRHLVR